MRMRAVSVLLLTLLVSAWAVPADAIWQPHEGAVFNRPTGTKEAKWRIIRTVEKAISNTTRGQTILISTFLMDRRKSANALIHAKRRGVHVRIVMDGDDARTATSRRIARVLNRDNRRAPGEKRWGRDHSFLKFCKGSCRGGGETTDNHSKFYAFSRIRSKRNVVMVSASNLNGGGATLGWNDLYTVVEQPKLYQAFAAIHQEMAQDTPADDRYRQFIVGRYTARFFPTRHSGRAADPTYQDLRRVHCHGPRGRTKITVSMFWWSGRRGMYIARKLLAMDRNGCNVRIIYGAPSHTVATVLKNSAHHGGVKLWDSRFDRDLDGIMDLRVHHKYWLVHGNVGRDRSTWEVHTGSQNWGRGSMIAGDELTLNIKSRRAYNQYLANWNDVRVHGSRHIGLDVVSEDPAIEGSASRRM